MSFQAAQDPIPGDSYSCSAIETVIVPKATDLGGFEVRRALPSRGKKMIGPFIFFDQMGPTEFLLGNGLDVRPHPHIGLATVTYLFTGAIDHRDSLGTEQAIEPGAVNWMTAGRGIAHSERTPAALRTKGTQLFGIQSWIALPKGAEERGVYLVSGEIEIAGDRFAAPQFLVFRPGDAITIRAVAATRLMILGGAAMDGHRYIWWNFVSSRRERIKDARRDWEAGRFDKVQGEAADEFIPAPPPARLAEPKAVTYP